MEQEIFGPYRLEELLGAGGMGDVWHLTHPAGPEPRLESVRAEHLACHSCPRMLDPCRVSVSRGHLSWSAEDKRVLAQYLKPRHNETLLYRH